VAEKSNTKLSQTGSVRKLGNEKSGFWVNLTEAAEILGITRQHAYKRATKPADKGGFKTLRQLGSKPAYVVNTTELDQILEAGREAREKEARRAEADAVGKQVLKDALSS
jgi:hypothetical protein